MVAISLLQKKRTGARVISLGGPRFCRLGRSISNTWDGAGQGSDVLGGKGDPRNVLRSRYKKMQGGRGT